MPDRSHDDENVAVTPPTLGQVIDALGPQTEGDITPLLGRARKAVVILFGKRPGLGLDELAVIPAGDLSAPEVAGMLALASRDILSERGQDERIRHHLARRT